MRNDRLAQLLSFLEKEPKDSFLKYALATEYLGMGDDQTALSYFTDLIETDPNYVGTYYHLGKLYERLAEKEKAEKIYKDGIIISKKASNLHAASELQQALNSLVGQDYEDD
jgi:Tfp pilus assembly protein PilF